MADTDVSRALVEAHFAQPGAETPVDKALRLDSQAKYAVVARGEADIYLRLPTRPA